MNRITAYFSSVFREIRAISWPNRKRIYSDTMVVVFALIFSGALIAILDYGYTQLFRIALERIG
jgi:preprotein translocase subunit SecE